MADFNRRSVERRSASLASIAALSSPERRSSRDMPLAGGFEIAQRVTDLRRLFVILAPHGLVEGVLEFLPFRERAFGVEFLQPGFQRMDFTALFQQVLARMLPVKVPNFLEAVFDDFDGFGVFFVAQ